MERNEKYQSWLEGGPSLLWIYGGPGKGKTMMSIYLTQQLERKYGQNVIYFFCSSGHQTRNTATAVIRTLLWQLLTKRPSLSRLVEQYQDPPERMQALVSTQGTLWELFSKAIQVTELGSIHCVIDGLDECDDASARWLAVQFATLAQEKNNGVLNLLVVSRGMLDFGHVKQIHLDPDNDHNVAADIENFASAGISVLSRRLQLSDHFCSKIQGELLRKAGGTFLWVGYAMNELLAKETSLELQEAMDDLPTELPALYSRMLRRVASNKRETIVAMLNWIALAIRPLTPSELCAAITCQIPGDFDRSQYTSDLVTICQPFISVQNGTVLLVHQSAKDYLLRKGRTTDGFEEDLPTSIANAHLPLANACLDALETPFELTPYATEHWAGHFRQTPTWAQASAIEQNSFFDTVSAIRRAWWMNYVKLGGLIYRGVIRGQCPPPFHIACYFDIKSWAQKILSQEHSSAS
jgi:hypothetical protein